MILPSTTATAAKHQAADVALLPIGSFEQHGAHLPLATDSLIAGLIAERIASAYDLLLLPTIPISCSHEHEGLLAGTTSIRASTLYTLVNDIADSLERQGIHRLALISGHGGNYVLSNVAQEASASRTRRMLVYPSSADWNAARTAAGCELTASEDMHAGEGETSILLHAAPSQVGDYKRADHRADHRPDLLLHGVEAYAPNGVIGQPSLASAEKGRSLLDALTNQFAARLEQLRAAPIGHST
ncbi:creatininase family protein [Saccharopolyspora sp. NPDC049357]|uniref:creatininase family protein n=1 Tax=Saccharopolyspora sp. NPDC049357 TaxID=3154507 RepID=UPI00342E80B4